MSEGTTGGPGLYVLAYARADLLDLASECSDAASAFSVSARASSRSRLRHGQSKFATRYGMTNGHVPFTETLERWGFQTGRSLHRHQ